MDVALGLIRDHLDWNSHMSLNPCCNGCRTWTDILLPWTQTLICLNPCCNGCRTWTIFLNSHELVSPSLNPCCNGCRTWTHLVFQFRFL